MRDYVEDNPAASANGASKTSPPHHCLQPFANSGPPAISEDRDWDRRAEAGSNAFRSS